MQEAKLGGGQLMKCPFVKKNSSIKESLFKKKIKDSSFLDFTFYAFVSAFQNIKSWKDFKI